VHDRDLAETVRARIDELVVDVLLDLLVGDDLGVSEDGPGPLG
jgi:hypothetical protein